MMSVEPQYPTYIYGSTTDYPGVNTNNSTRVNKDYMDKRDEEIRAIEAALGAGLVPGPPINPPFPLSSRVKVDGSGNLLLARNGGMVGVGTDTLVSTLNVRGNTTFFGALSDKAQIGNDGLSFAFNRNVSTGDLFNVGVHAYQLNHTGRSSVGAEDYLAWQVYKPPALPNTAVGELVTAHALVITGQGRIGVGITNPSEMFEVSGGNMKVSGGNMIVASGGTRLLDLNRTNVINEAYVWQVFRENSAEKWWFGTEGGTNRFDILKANGSSVLSIKDTGYVGIGTVNPGALLELSYNGTDGVRFNMNALGSLTMNTTHSSASIELQPGGSLLLGTVSPQAIYIGRTGITTAVRGTVRLGPVADLEGDMLVEISGGLGLRKSGTQLARIRIDNMTAQSEAVIYNDGSGAAQNGLVLHTLRVGDTEATMNGSFVATGKLTYGLPTSEPDNLGVIQVTAWLDERPDPQPDYLKFRVRLSDGTYKTATLTLT